MKRRNLFKSSIIAAIGFTAWKNKNFAGTSMCILSILFSTSTQAQNIAPSHTVSGISQSTGNVEVYNYPRISPHSNEYKCKAGGNEIFVYQTSAGPFVAFSSSGSVNIEIEMPIESNNVSISPKRYCISPDVNGKLVSFTVPGPMLLALEIDGMPVLYIYINPLEKNVPDFGTPNVRYFKAGQVYEVGELYLRDNETLYIEGGAVVRGCIRATSAKNVQVTGFGVLDGGYYRKGVDGHRSIVFEDCQNSTIEDIIMIEPTSWMIVLGICRDITVKNVKQLGSLGSTDGADIVGSKRIRIENCFFRNGDDCIAVKSLDLRAHGNDATLDYSRDVEDVEINGCAFLSYIGGQALEIGHELRTSSIKNIRFINCDILGVHGFGGVFGIHNSDRATVRDVLYENIRVEHHYDKLIDIKVIKSRWSKDTQRGQIENVIFRNIDVAISEYNPGYSCSLIGGYDSEHTVSNVLFEDFRLNGVKVLNPDQMDLFSKQANKIIFK